MLFLSGDLRRIPLKSDQADLVVCSEVLEHIKETQICLQEIYRILRPGGMLILSTPQPYSILELLARIALSRPLLPLTRILYRETILPMGHINLMTTAKLTKKLQSAGFTIIKTHSSGLYLPGLAEIPLPASMQAAAWLNARLCETKLSFLLWTQFFVAKKTAPFRQQTSPK